MRKPVLVATGTTGAVLAHLSGVAGALSADEQARMARLRRPADRDDYLAAHLLLRWCAGSWLEVRPDDIAVVQRCATCGGPHGRPEVAGHPGLHASLAHSRGVVAAAAGPVPVGVDVEAHGRAGGSAAPHGPGLEVTELGAVLTRAECDAIAGAPEPAVALLRLWARKEGLLKAGVVELEGLAGLDLVALPLDSPPAGGGLRAGAHGAWAVLDWEDEAGVGAVAVPAGTDVTLSRPGAR